VTASRVVLASILCAALLIWWARHREQHRRAMYDNNDFMIVTSAPRGVKVPPVHLRTIADLKFLTPSNDRHELMWPKGKLTTFARNVTSFVPSGFEAYAKIFNPFDLNVDPPATVGWKELAAKTGIDIRDGALAEKFAYSGDGNSQARVGEIHQSLINPLIEHLVRATTTRSHCFFAAWEGYGGTIARKSNGAMLDLPGRSYYVFEGPVEGARDTFDPVAHFASQTANLWWPEDHAWFVANDTDWAWTYVGGSRKLIDEILKDSRFNAVEVSATDRW